MIDAADWKAILVAFIGILGSWLVSRNSRRAEDRKTRAVENKDAGSLALEIAERADKRSEQTEARQEKSQREIDSLRSHLRRLDRWWPVHERTEQAVVDELISHNPDAIIPVLVPMPTYVPLEDND